MDKHDQELLEKQFRFLNPRHDSAGPLTIMVVFFAGLAIGGFLYAYQAEPMRIASNDMTAITSSTNGSPQQTRTQ